MKAQCPKCKNEQDIPKEYEGQNVKCLSCKASFLAKEFIPPPPVKPPPLEQPSEPPPIKCPNCGSTQIMGGKKGFSGGKAVGSALVLGPLGVLAGLHGSKKIVVSCLNCGHKWEPKK